MSKKNGKKFSGKVVRTCIRKYIFSLKMEGSWSVKIVKHCLRITTVLFELVLGSRAPAAVKPPKNQP